MDKTMIVSEISDGQIDTAADQLRAAMRKHRSEVTKDAAQLALGADNLGMRLFAVFRELAEMMSGLIVHHVKVNRTRSPEQALIATGRKLYVTDSVVAAMPHGKGERVKLVYFEPSPDAYDKNRVMSCAALEREYDKHGLEPDPIAQAADNEADPAFADAHPNACQWKDADGNYCYVAFGRWRGERDVRVRRIGAGGWRVSWLFEGRRKAS